MFVESEWEEVPAKLGSLPKRGPERPMGKRKGGQRYGGNDLVNRDPKREKCRKRRGISQKKKRVIHRIQRREVLHYWGGKRSTE